MEGEFRMHRNGKTRPRSRALRWSLAAGLAAAATVLGPVGGAWAAYDPHVDDNDPAWARPYAQPADAAVPVRGCQTIAADPANPPSGPPRAVQVIYAWHSGNGDHYPAQAQYVAKKVDRVDWMVDESSNYDQHVNLSCRYTPNGTYADYAQALVHKVQVPDFNPGGSASTGDVRAYLAGLGYNDPNRVYLVFADFDTGADAGGGIAIFDEWRAGVALHEMLHTLGAAHSWSTENGGPYNDDVMGDTGFWAVDQDRNGTYDPQEPAVTFFEEPYPSTAKYNTAGDPALTTPVCCDVGYSNDLLTAQERTIEAAAPWSAPTGFSVTGGGWIQVTPPGAPSNDNAVSARYYDGRRSLTMNVQSYAEGVVSVTRRPAVTAGSAYKFYVRLTTGTTGNVKLRISWFNSANALLSTTDSAVFALSSAWDEYDVRGVAPAGAAKAQVGVVSPAGQTFSYVMDTLNLMNCNNPKLADGCRRTY
jgi:hypothetical protein